MDINDDYRDNYNQYNSGYQTNNQSQKIIPVNITNALKRKFNLPMKSNTSYLSNHNKKKNQTMLKSPSSTIKNKAVHNVTNSKIMTDDSRNELFSTKSGYNTMTNKPKTPLNNYTNSPGYFNDSRGLNRPSSTSKLRSPSSNYSSRCHKYHTDLDFNYLADKKFYNDATNLVKRNLSTDKYTSSKKKSINYGKGKTNESNLNVYSGDTMQSHETGMDSTNKGKFRPDTNNKNAFVNSFTKDKKQSEGVLGDLLDSHFSVNSPSRKKIFQNEMDQMKSDDFRQKVMSKESYKDRIYIDEDHNTKVTINLSFVGESPQEKFVEALENIMVLLDPIFDRLTLGEKIEKFLENTNDSRRVIKLGAVVGLYIILIKYEVDDSYRNLILENVINLLGNFESHEEIFLVACLEICCNYSFYIALYGPHPLNLENMSLFSMFLTDFNYPKLQKAAFYCLMRMDYDGIKNLIDISSKDYQDLQHFILQSLIKTPHIQKIIVIPALLNDVFNSSSDKRHIALAAMNRMYDLVGETEAVTILSRFFQDQSVEKLFLSSTLRTSGEEGEQILLNLIHNTKDFKLKVAISSVLSYRIPKNPKYLDVSLERNDAYSLSKNIPGSLYRYYGKISPVFFENDDITDVEYIEVNTRDLLAALQRMLLIKHDHSNPKLVHHGHYNNLDDINIYLSKNEKLLKYAFFEKKDNDSRYLEGVDKYGKRLVPESFVRALAFCLRDYNPAVRETAASAIGKIGMPEGVVCLDKIIIATNDADVNVKTKAIWALGKLAPGCDTNAIFSVLESLKSNIWKVKMSCLVTITAFGDRCAGIVLPTLRKMLKDCTIQKQIIAETIVKLGIDGESCLLEIMRNEVDSNYKLKSSIAKSLALTNINSPNIDFIVESLYKAAQSNNSIIRKSALFALRMLHEKSEERVTYLKTRHILPFYYKCLSDKEPEIQAYAISCIKNLGPQGELLFIEGLTKDSNYIIRAQCAIGLAEIGATTIRTLIVALYDENQVVKKTIEKEIVEKFSIEAIVSSFQDKPQQKSSLKIAIRDILDKNLNLSPVTHRYFKDLYIALDKEIFQEHNVSNLVYNQQGNQEFNNSYNNSNLKKSNYGENNYYNDNMENNQVYEDNMDYVDYNNMQMDYEGK